MGHAAALGTVLSVPFPPGGLKENILTASEKLVFNSLFPPTLFLLLFFFSFRETDQEKLITRHGTEVK